MGIEKYRGVEEMPPVRRAQNDPQNLRITLFLLALGRRLARAAGAPLPPKGLSRYRSLSEAQAAEDATGKPPA